MTSKKDQALPGSNEPGSRPAVPARRKVISVDHGTLGTRDQGRVKGWTRAYRRKDTANTSTIHVALA